MPWLQVNIVGVKEPTRLTDTDIKAASQIPELYCAAPQMCMKMMAYIICLLAAQMEKAWARDQNLLLPVHVMVAPSHFVLSVSSRVEMSSSSSSFRMYGMTVSIVRIVFVVISDAI